MFFRLLLISVLVSCLGFQAENDASIEAFFTFHDRSKSDDIEKALIALIDAENSSIRIATFEIGLWSVVNALKRAQKRGAKIEIITDFRYIKSRPIYSNELVKKDIPIYIWKFRGEKSGLDPFMHNKFFVFGNQTVWTGSFNLTKSSTLINAENAIIIRDPSIAQKFINAFEILKKESRPYVMEKKPFWFFFPHS